jgi:predicted DNA-binding transcriptional regulator AlpA
VVEDVARLDILGTAEVAEVLGVGRSTVRAWITRGHLPKPDAQLQATPVWRRSTIERWASTHGRDRVLLLQQL